MIKTIKNFLTNTIYKKSIISLMLFIIIPIIILGFYIFNYFKVILIENSTQFALDNMSMISLNLDKTLESMMTTAKFIGQDRTVIQTLTDINNNDEVAAQTMLYIRRMFSNIQINYLEGSFHISVIPSGGEVMSTWQRNYNDYAYFKKESWYVESINKSGEFIWIAPQQQYIKIGDGSDEKTLISVSTSVFDTYTTNDLGVVLISIGEEELNKLVFSKELYQEGNDFFLLDKENTIISNRNKELIGKKIEEYLKLSSDVFEGNSGYRIIKSDNNHIIVNYFTVKKTQWKIIQVIPYENLALMTDRLINKVLFISIILLILILVGVFVFSSKITLPLRKLIKLMKKVENGNMDVEIKFKGNDEIYLLGNEFNNMMSKQKLLMSKIAEEERALAEEQRKKDQIKIEMLMAQINPHFLFNTLNTIKWTAMMGATDTVTEMVSNLGTLLENSLNRGNEFIALKEELENVKSYIFIQKIRFGNLFTMEYNIQPDTENCLVPKFILQPLVENSIIHGVENIDKKGVIGISASIDEEKLSICVEDNGAGIDDDNIKKLLNSENLSKDRLSGIGLGNVNERVKLYYGDQYGIVINSVKSKGTRIYITIPCNFNIN